jgi:hypothetical protein
MFVHQEWNDQRVLHTAGTLDAILCVCGGMFFGA